MPSTAIEDPQFAKDIIYIRTTVNLGTSCELYDKVKSRLVAASSASWLLKY